MHIATRNFGGTSILMSAPLGGPVPQPRDWRRYWWPSSVRNTGNELDKLLKKLCETGSTDWSGAHMILSLCPGQAGNILSRHCDVISNINMCVKLKMTKFFLVFSALFATFCILQGSVAPCLRCWEILDKFCWKFNSFCSDKIILKIGLRFDKVLNKVQQQISRVLFCRCHYGLCA